MAKDHRPSLTTPSTNQRTKTMSTTHSHPDYPSGRYFGDFDNSVANDQISFIDKDTGRPITVVIYHPLRVAEDLRQGWGEKNYSLLDALYQSLLKVYVEKRTTEGHRAVAMKDRARSVLAVFEEMLEKGSDMMVDGKLYRTKLGVY